MFQNTEISLGADICRSTKKDVLKIIRGPSKLGEAKNGFLLSALSHLKLILAAGAVRLKMAFNWTRPHKHGKAC